MDTSRATQRMVIVLVTLAITAGLLPLFPVALVFRFFHSYRITVLLLGVLSLVGLPGLLAWRARPIDGPGPAVRLAEFARWTMCGAAGTAALVAVALTAQAVRLDYVLAAQGNTAPYALLQPVAAAVCAVVTVLAIDGGSHGGGAVAAGWAGVARHAALLGAAVLGTLVFLAGGAGPVLPPAAWLALKAGATWLALLGLTQALRRLPEDRRLALAWAALLVALLNVAGTAVVLGRPVVE